MSYEGPPMRALRGVDYCRVFCADGISRVALPIRVDTGVIDDIKIQQSIRLASAFGEIEEHRTPNYYGGITHAAPVLRGWCPKLAEVNA